ncbi:MAG: hypothetical protein WDM89_19955 [Rhizomicrobium sp.]
MLTPQKTARLRSFLGALPPNAAARLAKAVEIDRLTGGRSLPHELILDALRPSLREDPDRTPAPLRLFCQPFEDLLVEQPVTRKQKGRIARGSAVAIWHWLSDTLLFDTVKLYSVDVKRLVLQGREAETRARAGEFWPLAGAAIRDALAKDRGEVRATLQSDVAVADAEEIAMLLSAGAMIADIQNLLPKGAPHLSADSLKALRSVHDRLAATTPDAAPYIAVIAMNRLAHPWEALQIPQIIVNQTQDTLISGTDMGMVGELLLSDIEMHGNAVRAVRHPVFDVDELIGHLAHFTELSSHIVREIEVRRGGTWGKRLLADRAAVAETMDGLMERATGDILNALPVHAIGGYGGGPKSADVLRPVLDEKAERALRYAKLLAAARITPCWGHCGCLSGIERNRQPAHPRL